MRGVTGSSEDRYDSWGPVWPKTGADIAKGENRVSGAQLRKTETLRTGPWAWGSLGPEAGPGLASIN